MSLETSAKLRQIVADNCPHRRPGGAPIRWMALGAMLCTISLGAACGGGSETTTAADTAAGAAAASTTNDTASTTAPSGSTGAPAASTATVPFPASLVGTWRRTVTKEDVARASANSYLVGRCTLTVAAGGDSNLTCPAGPFTGRLIPTGDGEMQIAMGTTLPNAYGWVVDGSRLTLTTRDDPTPDRVAVMEGVWQRA
jgi:hypothetical protein